MTSCNCFYLKDRFTGGSTFFFGFVSIMTRNIVERYKITAVWLIHSTQSRPESWRVLFQATGSSEERGRGRALAGGERARRAVVDCGLLVAQTTRACVTSLFKARLSINIRPKTRRPKPDGCCEHPVCRVYTMRTHCILFFAGLLQVSYFEFRRKQNQQQQLRHSSFLRRRLIGQFRLIDGREAGSNGEHQARAHPSQPYFVNIDDETGELLEVIESDSLQHPLSNLADIRTPRDARNEEFFYFVAPHAQGSVVRHLLSRCFGLRRAEKRQDPESLDVIEGALNQNLYSRQGLIYAKELDLVGRSLFDVYDTSYFYEGIKLFSPEHRARGFLMMEHPIHSAEKLFLAAKARGAIKANMKFVSFPNR